MSNRSPERAVRCARADQSRPREATICPRPGGIGLPACLAELMRRRPMAWQPGLESSTQQTWRPETAKWKREGEGPGRAAQVRE